MFKVCNLKDQNIYVVLVSYMTKMKQFFQGTKLSTVCNLRDQNVTKKLHESETSKQNLRDQELRQHLTIETSNLEYLEPND